MSTKTFIKNEVEKIKSFLLKNEVDVSAVKITGPHFQNEWKYLEVTVRLHNGKQISFNSYYQLRGQPFDLVNPEHLQNRLLYEVKWKKQRRRKNETI